MTNEFIYRVLNTLKDERKHIENLSEFALEMTRDQVSVELIEEKVFEPQAYYNFIDLVSSYISNMFDIDSLETCKDIAEHEFISNYLYHSIFKPKLKETVDV